MQANNVMTNTPPATIEEIFKFLGQFEPRKCDFCGCNEWTVMLNAHGQPSVVDHNQYNIIKEGDAYVYMAFLHGTTEKCILVRCKNAGRSNSSHIVRSWSGSSIDANSWRAQKHDPGLRYS